MNEWLIKGFFLITPSQTLLIMLKIVKRISQEVERKMAMVISYPLYATLTLPQLIILARSTYTTIFIGGD